MNSFLGSADYTPQEDIRDVLQIISLVKSRPALKLTGEHRGTAIGYAELQRMEKRLKHAAEMLEAAAVKAPKFEGGIDANDNFVRPMGAPSLHSELEQAIINHLRGRPMTASQLASELANISPSATEAVLTSMAGKRLVWRDDRNLWSML